MCKERWTLGAKMVDYESSRVARARRCVHGTAAHYARRRLRAQRTWNARAGPTVRSWHCVSLSSTGVCGCVATAQRSRSGAASSLKHRTQRAPCCARWKEASQVSFAQNNGRRFWKERARAPDGCRLRITHLPGRSRRPRRRLKRAPARTCGRDTGCAKIGAGDGARWRLAEKGCPCWP